VLKSRVGFTEVFKENALNFDISKNGVILPTIASFYAPYEQNKKKWSCLIEQKNC
jgi:hypothetical protein